MAYVNKKARLHTPEGTSPAYNIFPEIVLDCIYDSLANATNPAYKIVDENSKIKPQYLSIMGSTVTQSANLAYYVYPEFLPMLDSEDIVINGSTVKSYYVKHSYLDILDANGKIDTQYLPSYVDDVVDVIVFTGDDYPTTGDIGIKQQTSGGVTTYKFWVKSGNTWVAGNGDPSAIYIGTNTADSAIFRCSSTDTTTALKVSENPYVVNQAITNGVQLSLDGSNLSAVAQKATTGQYGTVMISGQTTHGVYLSTLDGVVSACADYATGTLPGTVIVVGSTDGITTAETMGYPLGSVVPSANWMISYVGQQISQIRPVVAHATTADYGVVRIAPLGNISVDDGVISVLSASTERAGVVYLTTDMVNATAAQDTYAVTLSGIRTYIATALSTYQTKLVDGDGITFIPGTTATAVAVDLDPYCALTVNSSHKLTVTNATAIAGGVVAITDLATDVAAEKSVVTNTDIPLAVTPNAVKKYIDTLTGAGPADYGSQGVVIIQHMASATENDANNLVPKAADVKDYIGIKVGELQTAIVGGTVHGPTISDSAGFNDLTTNSNSLATVQAISGFVAAKAVATSAGEVVTSNGSVDAQGNTVPLGGVRIWNKGGIDVENGVLSLESAAAVTTSNGNTDGVSIVPLGGVRVWTSGGIKVENGVLSLNSATATTYGGVMLSSETGLYLNTLHQLKLDVAEPLHISANKLNIRDATRQSAGVVQFIASTADGIVMNDAAKVPYGADVVTYVTSAISSAAETKIGEGVGIDITPVSVGGVLVSKTISVDYDAPIIPNGSGGITIRTAQGEQVSDLTQTPTALGAVWVRTAIRPADTISSDTTAMKAGTVPTEQAVRTLVDSSIGALRYLEYDIVD